MQGKIVLTMGHMFGRRCLGAFCLAAIPCLGFDVFYIKHHLVGGEKVVVKKGCPICVYKGFWSINTCAPLRLLQCAAG